MWLVVVVVTGMPEHVAQHRRETTLAVDSPAPLWDYKLEESPES